MQADASILVFCVPIAWVLYLLLTRRFTGNDRLGRVALFGLIFALTSVALAFALGLMSMALLRQEKQKQRELLASRVVQTGGWEAVRKDCLSLIEKHRDDYYFHWNKWSTNMLPASIAALKPWYVDYENLESRKVHLIRIKVFGTHSTGGHSTPYLGVEVITGPGSSDYLPQPRGGVSVNGHHKYSKVAEDVYEIY